MSDKTLSEIYELKKELEVRICQALSDFESETGLCVGDTVFLVRDVIKLSGEPPSILKLDIEVSI